MSINADMISFAINDARNLKLNEFECKKNM